MKIQINGVILILSCQKYAPRLKQFKLNKLDMKIGKLYVIGDFFYNLNIHMSKKIVYYI